MMKSINQRLKHICYLKGLTHRQVANDLNINSQQFNNWCNNTKPTIEGLEKIVRYFPDLNVRWFISGEGDPFQSETKNANSKNRFNLNLGHEEYDVNNVLADLDFYIRKLKKIRKGMRPKSENTYYENIKNG